MTNIDARLSEAAGLLNANLTAIAEADAKFDAIVAALAGGSITVVRLATALADLDGVRKKLDAQAAGLASLPSLLGLTVAEVREIRHRERQRLEQEAQGGNGRPSYLRAVGD